MRLDRFSYRGDQWSAFPDSDSERTLVLLFADPSFGHCQDVWAPVRSHFRHSVLLGCSTAGNIAGDELLDGSVEAIAVRFEHTALISASAPVSTRESSFAAGLALAQSLPKPNLRALFLLSDGLIVNGTELLRGLNQELPPGVVISGGLAGDGSRFAHTWVLSGGGLGPQQVSAVAFYGNALQVSHGSQGGWDKFGLERRVTRSAGPVLYELDGQPALQLYKKYLGEKASGLPATGLLFPLTIRADDGAESVVRTILQVNEEEQSLIFAGDIPQGSRAQLMKANLDSLVQGASQAAGVASMSATGDLSALAIAVSCVGRRLVLRSRADEELEAAILALPPGTAQVGFYSYGEIAPRVAGAPAQLHNQTMTVTLFREQLI